MVDQVFLKVQVGQSAGEVAKMLLMSLSLIDNNLLSREIISHLGKIILNILIDL